jgi:hypothetical protein
MEGDFIHGANAIMVLNFGLSTQPNITISDRNTLPANNGSDFYYRHRYNPGFRCLEKM